MTMLVQIFEVQTPEEAPALARLGVDHVADFRCKQRKFRFYSGSSRFWQKIRTAISTA
jgi:hypothetical protein